MNIPKSVKVGAMTYEVKEVDHELCVDREEVKGRIDYERLRIEIRNDIQTGQRMEETFLHELVHAITRERQIAWEDKDELYTEEIARGLHQVITDNPSIFGGETDGKG